MFGVNNDVGLFMIVIALLNGDAGDTDSSQETFEVNGSGRRKMTGMPLTTLCFEKETNSRFV